MKIKGVVLDMDGLMFDTELLTFKIWNEILTEKGYDYSFEIYKQTIGIRTVEVKKFYSDLYGKSFDYDKIYREAIDRFWKYTEEKGVPIKKGLFELLDFLKKSKIKVALATSTTTKSAREILRRAKVLEYFDILVCGDMVTNGKPHPEVFLKAANKLELKTDECIGLEDSINGIRSLYNANMKAVMIPDLIEPTDEIKPMIYKVCKDLTEVVGLIDN